MKWYYERASLSHLDEALDRYGAKEFASPTRSTVALLSWLKHEPLSVSSVLQQLGLTGEWDGHLEFQVRPRYGEGRSSHTDLLALTENTALAVEAKWTEAEYDKVTKWLRLGSSPENRREVLAGWLALLQPHSSRELLLDDFVDAIYQMVHRAASACSVSRSPRLAYLLFTGLRNEKAASVDTVKGRLSALWRILGSPEGFPFFVVEVGLKPTKAFEEIKDLQKGDEETSVSVKGALKNDANLFQFETPIVSRIGDQL